MFKNNGYREVSSISHNGHWSNDYELQLRIFTSYKNFTTLETMWNKTWVSRKGLKVN